MLQSQRERVKSQSAISGTDDFTNKVTSKKLNEYNQKLVDNHEDEEEILLKNLQQERLYKMMKDNVISRERSLWRYLDHYAEDCSNKIQQLQQQVKTCNCLESVADAKYAEEFLKNYFDEDSS